MENIIPESEENPAPEKEIEQTAENTADTALSDEAGESETAPEELSAPETDATDEEPADPQNGGDEPEVQEAAAQPEGPAAEDEPAAGSETDDGGNEPQSDSFVSAPDAYSYEEEQDMKRAARRKKGKAALIIVIAALVLIAAAGVAMNFVITPEKTVETFLKAMSRADLGELSRVAEIRGDEIDFTAENVDPMFELYSESDDFRREISACLLDDARLISERKKPSSDGIVDIDVINLYLFRLYKIAVRTTDVTVYTNFNDAKITLAGTTKVAHPSAGYDYNTYGYLVSDDYYDQVVSQTVFSGVLPGKYDVSAKYLSSFGKTFEAAGVFELDGTAAEYTLDIEFETVEILNSTEYEVSVLAGEQELQKLAPEEMCKIFPLVAGDELTVVCSADDADIRQTLIAGENPRCELIFVALTVNNSGNAIPVDVFINGRKNGSVPASEPEYRLYPLNVGDKVELVPQNPDFASLLEPMTYTAGEDDETLDLQFVLKGELYTGADEAVKKDIASSFEIINRQLPKADLDKMVGEYKTLDQLAEYADHETAGIYMALSEPEVSIDLTTDTHAYFPDDESIHMTVEAVLKFTVGYHEKGKQPTELLEKVTRLKYLLAYNNGTWVLE